MSKAARIRYIADGDYVDKQKTEFSLTAEVIEKLDSIEPSAERNAIQGVKVNGEMVQPDRYRVVSLSIPEAVDSLDSTSATDALSARQGRILYNHIKNLESMGKFLSNWDATTGLPVTNPTQLPYTYSSGDYYIVGIVGGTNYKPDGTAYTGMASSTQETEEVKVGDFYFYDGAEWLLLLNTERDIPIDESLSATSVNPVENRVVTSALNLKANDADISVVGKTNNYNDLDNLPTIPDSLDDLTGTSDNITEGTQHLFLTEAERTKLSNTTGVNTGDETQASIMSKLGAASSTTNGYLTSSDWSTFNSKQDAIDDLATIRSNAEAGKEAKDTIDTYGNIVTHNVAEFATAAQGALADTAIQPNDNVSELNNDAGYITASYHDDSKQDKLVAGTNIQISGTTISATDTTYTASDFDIKDLADSTGKRETWDTKQNALAAGSNIQINGDVISATDTKYTAGPGISISNNNVISAADVNAKWGNITGTLADQTDLKTELDAKQPNLTAGANIQIDSSNTISATDTKYTAGEGIAIDENNVISNTNVSAEWGNIQGTITDQTDLQEQFDTKQNAIKAGANIQIADDGVTISATDTTYKASDFDIKDLKDSTSLRSIWSNKQNKISAGTNIQIADDGVTISATDTTYTASDFDIKNLADSTGLRNSWSSKQNPIKAGTNIQIATDGVTISATDTKYSASDFDIKDLADTTGLRTTWNNKQNAISDLATIRSGAAKGATSVQPNDNVSTLTNDAGYITKAVNDLTNYYTKSETYTRSEIEGLIATFGGFEVVATLPTTDIKTNIIYLLGPVGDGQDKYEEYIYSNNTWVMIGETSVDLSDYFNYKTQNADDVAEGATHLFLTSAERTQIGKTTNTNTGDETKTTIQTKLGAASASKSGYLSSTDWTKFNNKSDFDGDYNSLENKPTIGEGTLTIQKNAKTIDTFSANATEGKTINVEVPTTVAELTDSSSYFKKDTDDTDDITVGATNKFVTTAEKNTWSGKQDKLTAGSNISISGNTISATDTTYESKTATSGGTDVSLVTTGEKYTWNNKQNALTAGSNISISGNTISATDTKYSAGTGISISGTTVTNSAPFSPAATGSTGQVLTKTASGYTRSTPESGNVIAMTQAEYNALSSSEKADGKLRLISDAPAIQVGNVSSTSISEMVVSSSAPASGTSNSIITFVI